MIHLLADENITGLAQLESDELRITTVSGRDMHAAQLCEVDALWVRSVTRVDAALLSGSQLRFIGTATAGTEHINTSLLESLGVAFACAPGANANSVLEYVIAALVELRKPWECLEQGGTLGVVGYGEVGKRLAAFAGALGWNLRVYDPWVAARAGRSALSEPQREFHSLDEVLACDVISVHCSLHSRTPWPSFHLLDERALSHLSSRQWLINAARGPVIDNQALLVHLRGPSPVSCVLDVWEGEPEFRSELLEASALRLGTPHIAGYSVDAKWQATRMLYNAMRDVGLVTRELGAGDYELPKLRCDEARAAGHALDELQGLLRQRYDIRDDDRRLRALASLPDVERGRGFDALRREYPPRRELRGSVLSKIDSAAYPLSERWSERLLDALGVTLDT